VSQDKSLPTSTRWNVGPKTFSNQLVKNNAPNILSHNTEDCTCKWDLSKWIFIIILELFFTTNIIINQYTPQQNFNYNQIKNHTYMAFTNTYNYVRKISEGHLQFYTYIFADLESELIVILWSHNEKNLWLSKFVEFWAHH